MTIRRISSGGGGQTTLMVGKSALANNLLVNVVLNDQT